MTAAWLEKRLADAAQKRDVGVTVGVKADPVVLQAPPRGVTGVTPKDRKKDRHKPSQAEYMRKWRAARAAIK